MITKATTTHNTTSAKDAALESDKGSGDGDAHGADSDRHDSDLRRMEQRELRGKQVSCRIAYNIVEK